MFELITSRMMSSFNIYNSMNLTNRSFRLLAIALELLLTFSVLVQRLSTKICYLFLYSTIFYNGISTSKLIKVFFGRGNIFLLLRFVVLVTAEQFELMLFLAHYFFFLKIKHNHLWSYFLYLSFFLNLNIPTYLIIGIVFSCDFSQLTILRFKTIF